MRGGCSDQLDRAMCGFGGVYIHRKPDKFFYWRGFLHDRATKRPTTHNRPKPAVCPVVDLRHDSHRRAFRATASRLAKEDVLAEHHKAHLAQVISRRLCVSGRLPDGRLHYNCRGNPKPPFLSDQYRKLSTVVWGGESVTFALLRPLSARQR